MRVITYLIVLLIILFGMTFATLNSDSVTVNYYIGEHTLPLSLLLVITFSLGCLFAMTIGFYLLLKTKLEIHRLSQRLHLAEKEIENLRAIPIQDKV